MNMALNMNGFSYPDFSYWPSPVANPPCSTLVDIGKEFERWNNVKVSLNVGSHMMFAGFLLDVYHIWRQTTEDDDLRQSSGGQAPTQEPPGVDLKQEQIKEEVEDGQRLTATQNHLLRPLFCQTRELDADSPAPFESTTPFESSVSLEDDLTPPAVGAEAPPPPSAISRVEAPGHRRGAVSREETPSLKANPKDSLATPNHDDRRVRVLGVKRSRGRPRNPTGKNERKAGKDKGPKKEMWLAKCLEHFTKNEEDKEEVTCKLCAGQVEGRLIPLAQHLKLNHGLMRRGEEFAPLCCPAPGCDAAPFSNYSAYYNHRKTLHRDLVRPKKGNAKNESQICFRCGKTTKNLTSHMNFVHGSRKQKEKTLRCPHVGCEKMVSTKKSLTRHMQVHSLREPAKCPVPGCDQYFKKRSFIKEHIKVVHESHLYRKFDCPHCSHQSKKEHHLKRHIMEVHGQGKTFSCPEPGCSQTFKRKCHLQQHALLHLNIKPFRCRWCHVTGAQQNNIRSHASTAHREEFLLAQHRKEKYWIKNMLLPPLLPTIQC